MKYPQQGGTGENTPFAVHSRKKEWDNGHDNGKEMQNAEKFILTNNDVFF